MAKYSKDLDESLKQMVYDAVDKAGLINVIDIHAIAITKVAGPIGEVVKANALAQLFSGEDVCCVALNEAVMLDLSKEQQKMIVESLVAQIEFDFEKDKLSIRKAELNIPLGMYHKYNDEIVKVWDTAVVYQQSLIEKEKEEKAAAKEK